MEEELLELEKQNHCRQHDTDVAKTNISQLEKRAKVLIFTFMNTTLG